ncbi:hypothetical protein FD755_009109 [Muntiacus reevesi]|uniref:Glucokinase regulatory protein second SIS domain-containing protein n=1 Tax=Muntiacus reevesi TaxID=9886 RepID=A0A5J5MLU9_MUNRE|nr:hypothetical protein FD755_009109 [Muntiacus reevesi]
MGTSKPQHPAKAHPLPLPPLPHPNPCPDILTDSVLPLLGATVQSLVRELRFCEATYHVQSPGGGWEGIYENYRMITKERQVLSSAVGPKPLFKEVVSMHCLESIKKNCFVYLVVVLGRGTAEFFQRLFQLSDSRHQMQKLQEKQEAFVLNPAIGILLAVIITPQPEDLSDSFWMKGRSTTNILLEALLPAAHKTVDHCSVRTIGPLCLLEILQTFEQAYQVTYGQSPKITTLMKQASTRCPGEKGLVYLVGWQTLGIIAITDGVECMHAFDFWAVHGFLIADRSSMFNQEVELINQGPHFSFSLEDFLTPILPSLTETDTVLFSFTLDDNLTEVQTLVEQVKEKISNIQRPGLSTQRRGAVPIPLKKLFPSIISITWPLLFFEYQGNFIQKVQHKLSTKWVLNTMSTGAHVLFAQILQNHMLDLLIHNFKLFCQPVNWENKILHAFLVSKVGAGQGSQGIYDPILATPVSPNSPSMMVREPSLGDPLPSATVG